MHSPGAFLPFSIIIQSVTTFFTDYFQRNYSIDHNKHDVPGAFRSTHLTNISDCHVRQLLISPIAQDLPTGVSSKSKLIGRNSEVLQKIEEVKLIRAWKIDSESKVYLLWLIMMIRRERNKILWRGKYKRTSSCYRRSAGSPHKTCCWCGDVRLIAAWNAAETFAGKNSSVSHATTCDCTFQQQFYLFNKNSKIRLTLRFKGFNKLSRSETDVMYDSTTNRLEGKQI